MSKSIIGEKMWAEGTEVQKAETVRSGRATLKQLAEGLLAGSDELRSACREHLAHTDASLEDISLDPNAWKNRSEETDPRLRDKVLKKRSPSKRKKQVLARKPKPRFGLPEGFTPRLQQHGRSVLLEDNVYSLPSGQEFIPRYPTGTLGKLRHLYALLTVEQFEGGRRGSVYVRTDGRIFDYSVNHADPSRDMFDTGYTIHNLERTGRYAPKAGSKKKQNEDLTPRSLAYAGP
ncbi:MAG: hypothetical protein ACR2IB_01240 [Pyrinomonadaceae bacterium]